MNIVHWCKKCSKEAVWNDENWSWDCPECNSQYAEG